jgi:hypothetical protein
MRRILLASLLCVWGPGHTQTLYRCFAHGVDSFQQSPCPASAKTISAIEVSPEPVPTDAQRRERARKAEQDRSESEFLSRMAGTDRLGLASRSPGGRRTAHVSGITARSDACQTARAARDMARRALGLNRTIDSLRQLDQGVAVACGRQ